MTPKSLLILLVSLSLFFLSSCDYVKKDYSTAQDLTIQGQIKGNFRVQIGDDVLFEPESTDVQFKVRYYSAGDKCHHTPWLTKQSYQEEDEMQFSTSLSDSGHYKISIPDRYNYRGCKWYISSIQQTGHSYPADTKQARFDVFCQKYIVYFGGVDGIRPRFLSNCVPLIKYKEPAYKDGLMYEWDGTKPRPPITVNIKVSDDVQCWDCSDSSPYRHLQPYDHEYKPTLEQLGTFEQAP